MVCSALVAFFPLFCLSFLRCAVSLTLISASFQVNLAKELAAEDTTVAPRIAAGAIAQAQKVFEYVHPDHDTVSSVHDVVAKAKAGQGAVFVTHVVQGTVPFKAATPFEVPFEGKAYTGEALQSLVHLWANTGSAEPSLVSAVREVSHHPEWFDLRSRCFILIGATSEMGPLENLLAAGATVVAIARQGNRGNKWGNLIAKAAKSPGRLLIPVPAEDPVAEKAGADATNDLEGLIEWLVGADLQAHITGMPTAIYNGIYMDGEGFVRASVAMDAICDAYTKAKIQKTPPSLLYIDTPSHAHVTPVSVQEGSEGFRADASPLFKWLHTAGLLKPTPYHATDSTNRAKSEGRVVLDALSAQQGPNYAVAKYLQRFRALVHRNLEGGVVSVTNGPPARTDSVMHSKTMAIVMDSMSLFPPNVGHEPETVQSLMANIMVRDLCSSEAYSQPAVQLVHPMDLFYENSWHGGMWRSPFDMDSCGKYAVLRHYFLRFGVPAAIAAVALFKCYQLM
jgi:hypothetical protein